MIEKPPQDFRLEQFTPYRLARAAQIVSDAFAQLYRTRFGLSVAEWRVLVHVADTKGASVRDIEARVGLEKSKVSRAATRLVERGLLSKKPSQSDGRLINLALTKSGQSLMAELLPLAEAFQSDLARDLDAAMAALDLGLDAVLTHVDAAKTPGD